MKNRLHCWGYNKYGQNNYQKSFDTDTVLAAVGTKHTCAVKSYTFYGGGSGLNYKTNAFCWGDNSHAQTDLPHSHYIGYLDCIHGNNWGVNFSSNNCSNNSKVKINLKYLNVVAGGDHTCVIGSNNYVKCFGSCPYDLCDVPYTNYSNYNSSHLSNNSTCSNNPCNSSNSTLNYPHNLVLSIYSGGLHNCVQHKYTSLSCFGFNAHGQTDIPSSIKLEPDNLSFNDYIISLGFNSTSALLHGLVITWGNSEYIDQTKFYNNYMYRPLAFQITTGWTLACIEVFRGGKICVGDNTLGQTNVPQAAHVVSEIAAGAMHACSLDIGEPGDRKQRNLVCWGNSNYGQTNYTRVGG